MDPRRSAPVRGWRRFDTLAVRLFLLMWVTLIASHLVSYGLSIPLSRVLAGVSPAMSQAPLAPPPGPTGPKDGQDSASGPPHGPPPANRLLGPGVRAMPPADLPATTLGIDYALRALVIALGAALGAAWAARPLRRLARAADALDRQLLRQEPLTRLDEARGTAEVRGTAAVFNHMGQRLQAQFDARGLHLAAVSHDLRTPLTRLRMRLESAPPALAEAAAADIHEMVDMIESTLELLREQRDGRPPARVHLTALLEALTDDLAAAGQTCVDLRGGPALQVMAHPTALRRVLANLIGNALQHGGGARVHWVTADEGGVWVHVDDDGPGIAPERLSSAQQPWVQLGPATGGHGLGLAIARDLADRDSARLALANRPEGGLRASLWLPTDTIVSAPTPGA